MSKVVLGGMIGLDERQGNFKLRCKLASLTAKNISARAQESPIWAYSALA